MTAKLLAESASAKKSNLPGRYNWQQFKVMQAIIEEVNPGIRITYWNGKIELMTLGEKHETISRLINLLLGLYFLHKGIEFIPVGSATRESETENVSFQPDESYYLGEQKEHPDLAIEIIITSGSEKKLEKYRRLNIAEVWFWQNNAITVYTLINGDNKEEISYKEVKESKLLPDLDLELLNRCILMPSKIAAMNEFVKGLNYRFREL